MGAGKADATPERIWETTLNSEWLYWLADRAGVSFPIRHSARPYDRDASAQERYADELRAALPCVVVEDALMRGRPTAEELQELTLRLAGERAHGAEVA